MGKPLRILTLVIIVITVTYMVLWNSVYKPLVPGYHYFYFSPKVYKQKIIEINDRKKELRIEDFKEIQNLFINSLTIDVFPFWYGTLWGFYGKSEVPGKGRIACGYFVTTTLQQIGLNLNKEKLAQCASEEMIRCLVQKKYIWHFNDLPLSKFLSGLISKGNGIYLIGLDNHTGYIYVKSPNEVRFIHSSGRFPFCVINENARESIVLTKSRYKVVGKISDDKELLGKWIKGTKL
jgi:hypothetical protein